MPEVWHIATPPSTGLCCHYRQQRAMRTGRLSTMELKIRQMRERAGLDQGRLAELAGMSRTYLNQIENGKRVPNMRRLEQIAGALGCHVADLLPSDGRGARIARFIDALEGLPDEDWEAVERLAAALKRARQSHARDE